MEKKAKLDITDHITILKLLMELKAGMLYFPLLAQILTWFLEYEQLKYCTMSIHFPHICLFFTLQLQLAEVTALELINCRFSKLRTLARKLECFDKESMVLEVLFKCFLILGKLCAVLILFCNRLSAFKIRTIFMFICLRIQWYV